MRHNKTFEIDFNKRVYFGEYSFIDNKLFIEEVYTQNEQEQRVEVDSLNDAELFGKIYGLVERDKCDELADEVEYNIWEEHHGRFSKLNDF